MASLVLTLPAGTTASAAQVLPSSYQVWAAQAGPSVLCNFSGSGVGFPGTVPAVGTVTLQVSNDPNANPSGTAAAQASARWNNHDVIKSVTGDTNSSIVFICRYVRLFGVVTSGTVQVTIAYSDTAGPAN
jgi:hypothetical protein